MCQHVWGVGGGTTHGGGFGRAGRGVPSSRAACPFPAVKGPQRHGRGVPAGLAYAVGGVGVVRRVPRCHIPAIRAWFPFCLARLRPASALRQHAMGYFFRPLGRLARRVLCSGSYVFAAVFVRRPAGKPLLSIAGVVLGRPKLRPRLF